jgi:Mg2+ and Co2+ transporter CorA
MVPFSFVTGLLGVTVGGIPARDTHGALAALCVLLGLLAVGAYLPLRRLRWVPRMTGVTPAPQARGAPPR